MILRRVSQKCASAGNLLSSQSRIVEIVKRKIPQFSSEFWILGEKLGTKSPKLFDSWWPKSTSSEVFARASLHQSFLPWNGNWQVLTSSQPEPRIARWLVSLENKKGLRFQLNTFQLGDRSSFHWVRESKANEWPSLVILITECFHASGQVKYYFLNFYNFITRRDRGPVHN